MSEANKKKQPANPTRLTGAEIVWATLEGEGVREVFGYPGRRDFAGVRCPAQISYPPHSGAA